MEEDERLIKRELLPALGPPKAGEMRRRVTTPSDAIVAWDAP